jgi:kumamolisin
VEDFAYEYGLDVIETNLVRRSIQLEGTAAALNTAFGVEMRYYETSEEIYRGHNGPIHVPQELDKVVEAVLGLDDRRVSKTRGYASPFCSLPVQWLHREHRSVATASRLRGAGADAGQDHCIGIIAFDGPAHGSYRTETLQRYFEEVLQIQAPEIEEIVVHGTSSTPGQEDIDTEDAAEEITLDILLAGAIAPGAKLAMYITERTEQGWVDALYAAISDIDNAPSVISISHCPPENDPPDTWTPMALAKIREAFKTAAARGITICCANRPYLPSGS